MWGTGDIEVNKVLREDHMISVLITINLKNKNKRTQAKKKQIRSK